MKKKSETSTKALPTTSKPKCDCRICPQLHCPEVDEDDIIALKSLQKPRKIQVDEVCLKHQPKYLCDQSLPPTSCCYKNKEDDDLKRECRSIKGNGEALELFYLPCYFDTLFLGHPWFTHYIKEEIRTILNNAESEEDLKTKAPPKPVASKVEVKKKKSLQRKTSKPKCDCRFCPQLHCPVIDPSNISPLKLPRGQKPQKIVVDEVCSKHQPKNECDQLLPKTSKCSKLWKGDESPKKPAAPEVEEKKRNSILDVIADKHCGCQVVARAIGKGEVHRNIGLSQLRDAINANKIPAKEEPQKSTPDPQKSTPDPQKNTPEPQ